MIPNLTATVCWTCHSQLALKIKDLNQIPKTNNNKKEDKFPFISGKLSLNYLVDMTEVQHGRDMNIILFCRVISKSLDIKVYFVFHSMSSSKSKLGFMLSRRLHMHISFPNVFENWWYTFMMVLTITTSSSLMCTSAKSSLFVSNAIY